MNHKNLQLPSALPSLVLSLSPVVNKIMSMAPPNASLMTKCDRKQGMRPVKSRAKRNSAVVSEHADVKQVEILAGGDESMAGGCS